MKNMKMLVLGMLFLGIPLMFGGAPARAGEILEFDMMATVPDNEFTIRDITGGGLAWVVDKAKGSLDDDGDLEINVKGLVLRDTGVNPSGTFTGVVSCLVAPALEGDPATTENVFTAPVVVGPEGDAEIKETLLLPDSCFAPIVLVVGDSGNWFAVTGGGPEPEEEEDDDEDDDLD